MNIKNKNFKRGIIVTLIVSTFFVNSGISYAKLSDAQIQEKIAGSSLKDCTAPAADGGMTLDQIYVELTNNYKKFLEDTTSNESATTSLMNTIIAGYREFKHDAENIVNALVQKNYSKNVYAGWTNADDFIKYKGISSYNDAFAYAQKCIELKDGYVKKAKEMMINKVVDSTNRKKAVMLMQKMQVINQKLRETNEKITTLYGLFKTFSNKIICFEAKKCMAL